MDSTLGNIPSDVLEKIAFFAAVQPASDGDGFQVGVKIGPPASLTPLLATNRRTNGLLNIDSNHHLYTRIFEHQFDLGAVRRRLGTITSSVTALELKKRWTCLKWIRAEVDSAEERNNGLYRSISIADMDKDILSERTVLFREEQREMRVEALWTTYLMMLENDGKNGKQLRDFAKIEIWLQDFWFDERRKSVAKLALGSKIWPADSEENALAMWLFWLLFDPSKYGPKYESFWNLTSVLKILALGAHKYELADPPWESFHPSSRINQRRSIKHFSALLTVAPPPLATPAILSFLTFVNKAASFQSSNLLYQSPAIPSCTDPPCLSIEWDSEWQKCLSLGNVPLEYQTPKSFKLGSIEGAWEGMFTYTEFGTYTSLLLGAPPQELINSLVVQHRQTWKLREYYLFPGSDCDHSVMEYFDLQMPLSPGDPLRSHRPTGTSVEVKSASLIVREPGREIPLCYLQSGSKDADDQFVRGRTVQDIIIFGEGHSAWGQFNLVGRVRPCDGFISLTKEYVGEDRGNWLYRGYLVGNQTGNLSGRWRDTRTPLNMFGYEGCFVMSRRK